MLQLQFIFCMLVVCTYSSTLLTIDGQKDIAKAFQVWQNTHGYISSTESTFRLSLFTATYQSVDEFNSRPNETWKKGINQFSILTSEQFEASALNNKKYSYNFVNSTLPAFNTSQNSNLSSPSSVFPTPSIDWTTLNAVTPVKNQGVCGSCWAFSAVAAIESYYLRVKGFNYSLSEQQIVSCDTQMYGCYGGDNHQALNSVINTGINYQAVYPYSNDSLFYGKTDRCNQALSTGPVKINIVSAVNPYANCVYQPNVTANYTNYTNNIYQAILLQPMGISADARVWGQYASGIFSSKYCGTYINHDIFLVGRVPGSYIKIKNSWGPYWGQKGFIRLQDVANVCGTSQCPLPYVTA